MVVPRYLEPRGGYRPRYKGSKLQGPAGLCEHMCPTTEEYCKRLEPFSTLKMEAEISTLLHHATHSTLLFPANRS